MNRMFLTVASGLGHVVTTEVTGNAQYLAGPDNAGITDLVTISPVEKGPEGCIVVDIGPGRDLRQGFTPFNGMGSSKRLLTRFFRGFALGFGPGLRLGGPDPGLFAFPLPASFLSRFTLLALMVGSLSRRCLLLPLRLFAPDPLGIDLPGQQFPLCQGQQVELLGSGQFIVGKQQLPLAKGVFQVGKLLGEEGLAPLAPSDLDGGPGLRPPAGKLGGTGNKQLNNERQQ